MIRHLFKLIWQKKKQNFLLITEMFVSFMVMFAVFSFSVNSYNHYQKPLGFECENVWVVNYSNSGNSTSADSNRMFYENLKNTLKSMREVKSVAFSSDNIPFSQTTNGDGLMYNKQREQVDVYNADEDYSKVLQMKMLEGRWFEPGDVAAKNPTVVINQTIKEKFFGQLPGVGKLINFQHDEKVLWKVIGVAQDMKVKGDYAEVKPAAFVQVDSGSFQYIRNLLIQVVPGADAGFESRLYKTIANTLKNANVEIEHLPNKRVSINKFTLVPLIALLVVAGFLIVNVALGLFGVLWYNINRRRGEIGLRRAVGATGSNVSGQLVGESLILATFALLIGAFFAVQFPLLNVFDLPSGVYLAAILFSILFIYLLVILCSLYPGRQAAAIYPAVALHED